MNRYMVVPEGFCNEFPLTSSDMYRRMDYIIEYNEHFFWYVKNRKTGYTGVGYYISDLNHHLSNIIKYGETV